MLAAALILLTIMASPLFAAEVSLEISAPASPPAEAASNTEIPAQAIAAMPTQIDSGDALRTVPGLQIAQHSGGGKANEYMMRGFFADHGTDIAFSADGLPLNLTSHGHGEGYTDLHMLIPETIESIRAEKGPYDPQQGNYATAGSLDMRFYDKLPESFVDLSGGSFATGRAAAGINLPGVLSRSYVAAEAYRTDGYVDNNEDYKRYNLFWKGTQDLTPHSSLTLLGTSMTSSWFGSGLIPARAVEDGSLSAFGSIDTSQGGKTERHNLSATYRDKIDNRQKIEAQVYYTRYILQLYSNFTFFLTDPVHGDGIEQDDNRQMAGGHAQYSYAAPGRAGDIVTTVGAESRYDSVDASLWNQENRIRVSSVSLSDIGVQTIGVYAKEEIPLTSRLRFMGGLRYDHGRFDADGAGADEAILSPKANLIFAASPNIDLFANYGRGFHSNDARTVVDDPGSGLVRAEGVEAGVRTHALDNRLTSSLVFWGMDLDSELTFDQDTGGTEASGPSRRAGIESEWGYTITSWLHSDLDIDFSQAKFRDTGGAVPLAVNQYISGGLVAQIPSGWMGALRFRDVGSRWGDDARTIPLEAYCVFDALVGYRRGHWGYQLAIDNIANTGWRDGQEVITSRLRGETSAVEDVNFTPGNPRTFIGSVKYYFGV